ncbi:hypothetical protein Bca4012_083646 [Brassica carinata]|uniref:Uncharacterized protein n=1 Tax=Brassica carinata TaxID=52824 RepID=A0A8X7SJ78_BRACI|nr:hypothetical protein Bca52824_027081 [Brassica carinata]
MAEDTSPVASPPPFVEVFCEISGKDYRFTTGTKAEFAVSVINRKLVGSSKSKALYIEAVKEGEEPISFGDGASLVSYGHGWRLKTVIADSNLPGAEKEGTFQRQFPSVLPTGSKDSKPAKAMKAKVEGDQSLKYIGRITFAFVLMFILGGLFTVALENLPRLILLFSNPSM